MCNFIKVTLIWGGSGAADSIVPSQLEESPVWVWVTNRAEFLYSHHVFFKKKIFIYLSFLSKNYNLKLTTKSIVWNFIIAIL